MEADANMLSNKLIPVVDVDVEVDAMEGAKDVGGAGPTISGPPRAANNESRVMFEVDVGKVMVEDDAVGGGAVGTNFANNLSTSDTAPAEECSLSE